MRQTKNYIQITIATLLIIAATSLGSFMTAEAQTTWTPCGRCEFEDFSEELGDLGFCDFSVAGVIYGCSGNNGSKCSHSGYCAGDGPASSP